MALCLGVTCAKEGSRANWIDFDEGQPSVAYDLRHTFITEMVVKGVELPKIAKWCGNSVRVIEERYSHLMPEHLKEMADLVGSGTVRKPSKVTPISKAAKTKP